MSMNSKETSEFAPGKTVAGRSVRELVKRRYRARVRFVLPMVGVVLALAGVALLGSKLFSNLGLIGAICFLGVAVVMREVMRVTDARERKMVREEKRAVRGAEGEETVGAIVDSLGDDYLVVHDVVSRYGNIDHVVIARHGGLYLLETKAHGGRVTVVDGRVLVNGRAPEKDFIAQTLNNTYWLRDRLREAIGAELWVTPVLVFVNAFVEPTEPVKGIQIVNRKFLPRVLQQPTRRRETFFLWEARQKIASLLSSSS